MPSKPRPLSLRTRVRHVTGVEKDVLRSRLSQLSPNWERVTDAPKKSTETARTATEPAKPGSQKE